MDIRGSTRIVGIFGDPVEHTLSPRMHNFAFSRLGLDFVYLPFHVRPRDLKSAVQAVRALNLAGVNVTIPHKQAILPLLDRVSPEARKIGAVNTVVNRGGTLIGHNTDASGFLSSLKEDAGFDPGGKSVVIWGAGGVAVGIAAALLEAGIRNLFVVNRTLSHAKALVRRASRIARPGKVYSETSVARLREEVRHCDLFVNALPGSVGPDAFPCDLGGCLSRRTLVFDANYGKQTPLLKLARRLKIPSLNGLGMLVHQGALAFSLWTGRKPPVALMRQALKK